MCEADHPWTPALFTCPECRGNLEVVLNTDAVREAHGPRDWVVDDLPGIWRYSCLLPLRGDVEARTPLLVGGTPLFDGFRVLPEVDAPGRLLLKDDTRNPSASFKDRASAVALAYGLEQGATVLAGASTGNAGASMACLAASLGRRAMIFIPRTAPRAKVAQLLLHGALVVRVDGTYDDAFDLCQRLSERHGWFNRNTGSNPYTREGKKTVSFEIVEQLGWNAPDVVFVPVGDGNILSGVWKGFLDLHAVGALRRLPRLVAVQSKKSNAVAEAWERLCSGSTTLKQAMRPVRATTCADSIAVDRPRDGFAALRALEESNGNAIQVNDSAILEAAAELARKTGLFAEPAGATALAGVHKWARTRGFHPDETVVALVTGSGLKDVDTLLEVAPEAVEVPRDVGGAWDILEERLRT
ncbi:MAG: threonine synthase [Pseudomonadota bacterium]